MNGRKCWAKRWCATVMVAGLAMLMSTMRAGAQENGSIDEVQPAAGVLPAAPGKVLAELDATSYAVRQTMTRKLLTDEKLTPGILKWLIDRAQSPEQLNRLLLVARHRVLRLAAESAFKQIGAASLGLSHQSVPASAYPWLKKHGAVRVLATVPGFPAYAHLEPGDVIVSLDGQPIADQASATRFKQMIQSHQCGDMVTIQIRREGQKHTLRFRLASSVALAAMYRMSDSGLELQGAFRSHWLRARRALLDQAPLAPTALLPTGERSEAAASGKADQRKRR